MKMRLAQALVLHWSFMPLFPKSYRSLTLTSGGAMSYRRKMLQAMRRVTSTCSPPAGCSPSPLLATRRPQWSTR
ncbi:hypothetical protein DPMN_136248 [Dreissena polymorpha]|uniref:Uncharacterized protein n=1 Tax=Dreissena polymorpha TaxID=45954 RepID=A0A9D4G3H5_DREPO|nr:hypothetical protein DPMN_136248 [Dreissena polymorpha]